MSGRAAAPLGSAASRKAGFGSATTGRCGALGYTGRKRKRALEARGIHPGPAGRSPQARATSRRRARNRIARRSRRRTRA